MDFLEDFEDSFIKSISALSKKLWTVEGEDHIYRPKLKRVNFR